MAGSPGLRAFAAKQQKDYGPEQVALTNPPINVTPTGSPALDWALRYGGWIVGQVYEIVGVKDAGKSTLMLTGAAIHQKLYEDRGVAYVDVENTFDSDWAAELGVDCSRKARKDGRWMHYYPPDSETASDMARDACKSGVISLVIVDSVGGMESKKALDRDAEKDIVGKNAQVISRMSKHLSSLARLNKCTILLVNQYRANVSNPMGSDVSAGPKVMQHATTAKIEMSQIFAEGSQRTAKFFGKDEVVSRMSRARVTRLKRGGAPSRVAEMFINIQETEEYGPVGFDTADELLALGTRLPGVIEQTPGGYYTMPKGEKFHGKPAILKHLRENQAARDEVRAAIPFKTPTEEEDDD